MQLATQSNPRPARITQHSRRTALLMISLVLISSCQAQAPLVASPEPITPQRADLKVEDGLRARIEAEIGEPRCTDDAQCRTLAVGEKACGGPLVWLPYSTMTARGDSLRASASKLAALQRRRYELTGQSSTCQYTPDPGALCKAQRCVLRPPGGAIY